MNLILMRKKVENPDKIKKWLIKNNNYGKIIDVVIR